MAQIVFNIPDAVLPRVISALSEGRKSDDPLTPAQYAKQTVINFIFSKVSNFESRQAAKTAGDTAIALTKNEVIIT